jgi:hypothetical protein
VRLRAGDALLVAGLDVDNESRLKNRRGVSRRGESEKTRLLVIVTATVI